MPDQQVSDFLEHFGVKGMQWGVRKGLSGGAVALQILRKVGKTNVRDIPSMRYSHGFEITNLVQNILDLSS